MNESLESGQTNSFGMNQEDYLTVARGWGSPELLARLREDFQNDPGALHFLDCMDPNGSYMSGHHAYLDARGKRKRIAKTWLNHTDNNTFEE